MADAIARATDVERTVSYGVRRTLRWRWLALGLFCFGFGVVFAWSPPSDFTLYDRAMTAFAILLGAAMIVYAVVHLLRPAKPMLVLSPQGIRMRIEWVKQFLIPWREVRGVDTIDIAVRVGRDLMGGRGVTVVLVSRDFYDRHIHVRSWVLRGPGWDANFVPKGELVQVALHHGVLEASAAELRQAVELRWRAFGKAA